MQLFLVFAALTTLSAGLPVQLRAQTRAEAAKGRENDDGSKVFTPPTQPLRITNTQEATLSAPSNLTQTEPLAVGTVLGKIQESSTDEGDVASVEYDAPRQRFLIKHKGLLRLLLTKKALLGEAKLLEVKEKLRLLSLARRLVGRRTAVALGPSLAAVTAPAAIEQVTTIPTLQTQALLAANATPRLTVPSVQASTAPAAAAAATTTPPMSTSTMTTNAGLPSLGSLVSSALGSSGL
ncbi:hypothetical protein PYCC9005_001239 [Savitreella phatthalungensis]